MPDLAESTIPVPAPFISASFQDQADCVCEYEGMEGCRIEKRVLSHLFRVSDCSRALSLAPRLGTHLLWIKILSRNVE